MVRKEQTIELPEGLDSALAAAMGNPGLATWGALLGRARLQPGEVALINGATGVTGRAAIEVDRKLGAARIIATGRGGPSLDSLRDLGVDGLQSVSLSDEDLTNAFRGILLDQKVDVVLDYLWGASATCLLRAAAGHGEATKSHRLRFVQVGSISGGDITLPAAILRSSGLELLGSGLGSLGTEEIIGYLREIYARWSPEDAQTAILVRPLREVETAWQQNTGGKGLVFNFAR